VGFFIGVNIYMNPKQQDWIYESPDRGQTVYRRKFGDKHFERQLVKPQTPKKQFYSDVMWSYRSEWDDLADKHPVIKEYLDKLITTVKLID
jgi:hypothetical protein